MNQALLQLKQALMECHAQGRAYDVLAFMVDQGLSRSPDTNQKLTFEAGALQAGAAPANERDQEAKDWVPREVALRAALQRVQQSLPHPRIELGYRKGLGRGNHSLYWLELSAETTVEDGGSADQTTPRRSVTYRRSEKGAVKPSSLVRWLMKDGEFRNLSPRGITMLLGIIIGAIGWALCLAMILLGLGVSNQPLTAGSLILLILAFAGFWFGWKSLYEPWFRLVDERIVKAPNWVPALFEDPCELEMYGQRKARWTRLVRYSADCPMCGGEIELVPGRPDQRLPLVGRCIESPHAHVFTFDRTTLKGAYIGPVLPDERAQTIVL